MAQGQADAAVCKEPAGSGVHADLQDPPRTSQNQSLGKVIGIVEKKMESTIMGYLVYIYWCYIWDMG